MWPSSPFVIRRSTNLQKWGAAEERVLLFRAGLRAVDLRSDQCVGEEEVVVPDVLEVPLDVAGVARPEPREDRGLLGEGHHRGVEEVGRPAHEPEPASEKTRNAS
jgi:hypothetical protein